MNTDTSNTSHSSSNNNFWLLLIAATLSGCTTSSFDENGRLVVRNFGVNQYIFDNNSPQYIDLRGSSLVGLYADGSVTIGYKNHEINRIYYGCRALILTNEQTIHDNVIQLVNELSLDRACATVKPDDETPGQLENTESQSIQLGYSTISLSPTYPPGRDVTAYSLDFWGMELGDIFGTGYRTSSVISSGNDCFLLLVTESQTDFEYYKSHLDFNQGKHLCIALKP